MITPKKPTTCLAVACLTVLTAVLPARADYPSTVNALGPLGYWRFNETTASPPLNQVVNVAPSGAKLNGIAILDIEKGQPGIVGTSIRSHNTGAVVGYCGSKIDIGYSPALNKKGPFSVEFWYKPNALGTDGTGFCIVSSLNNDFVASSRRGYLFYCNNNGRIEFRLGNDAGYVGNVNSGTSAQNAKIGQWTHIVGEFTGTETKLFLNGVQVGSLTLTAAQIASLQPNTQVPFRIGGTALTGSLSDAPTGSATGISGNRGVDGWVDEVAYYPYALTVSQAAAHFTTATSNSAGYGAAILADNPTAYWPMEDAATTAPDPSTFVTVANSGSAGSAVDGKVIWGGLTAQPGTGYAGMGADDKSVLLDGFNGFVKLPNSTSLDITGNLTMMAWIKPTQKNFYRDIIARGWDDANAETFLRISRGFDNSGVGSTNQYEVGVTDGVNYYDSVLVPMPEGDIGNWVFIAGTFDGAQWTLYRNGKQIGSLASENGPSIIAQPWVIGAQAAADVGGAYAVPGGISTYFPGSIDEPAIFNKALTADEIKAVYESALPKPIITKPVDNPDGFAGSTYPTLFQGGSVTLSVVAEGTDPLSYAWFKDGAPLGITTASLTLNNLAKGTPTYSVVVSNPNGQATSSVTLNVVAAPPTFVQNPISLARFAGGSFTFSVVTAGTTPQTFQWKTNGVDIAGATGTSYTGTASTDLNGVNFTVVATNEAGNKESSTAKVTVLPAATGYAAAVLGSSPFAYYRLDETTGTTAFDYVGFNNGVYFNTTLGQDGYSAVDSDKAVAFNGLNSYVGSLSGASINYQGTSASFTLEAWVKANEGLPDESAIISKGTGPNGTTANEQFSLEVAGGHYRLLTRGNGNAIYEADAQVGPNGSWQHVVGVYDQSSGSPFMSIYVNGELSGSSPGRTAGLRASTAPVAIGSKRTGNDPGYDGTFNGLVDELAIYSTALSDTTIQAHYGAAYGSNTKPQFAVKPKPATNYVTLSASFSASAFGTVPLTYQWRKGTTDIIGANGPTYTITGLTLADAGDYSVTVSNSAGSTNSGPTHLTVLAAPTSAPGISDLVIHLPFDSDLVDKTGRGNNGTAIAQTSTSSNTVAPTFVAGKLGNAFHYESDFGQPGAPGATTATNTSYLTLGHRPDLQFGTTTNFSIAFWIKVPENFIGGDLPFFTTTVGSLGGQGIVLAPAYGFGIGSGSNPNPAPANYGGWAASLYDTGSANGARIYGDLGSINDGQWHHLAYVFDRNASLVTYLDGEVAHATKISGTTTAAAKAIDVADEATIGQDPTGLYQETGAGDIDDFGVWRRALSPLEVASIYVAGNNNLSYNGGATLSISQSGTSVTLNWSGGTLQSADSLFPLSFTDVVGATSPKTITATGAAKFYRVKAN